MSEKKIKKKRIRGFPGVVKAQLGPLNNNPYFKEKFKDEQFKILLNTTDGKLAAIVNVEKGVVDVDSVKNEPKENINKKNLGWNSKLETTTPLFLDIATGKLSKGGIVKKMLTRKVKLKGIKNLLKLLKMFSILSPDEDRKATDKTKIYIVGGGIAGLAAAVFAIRDGFIPGENIHILESINIVGGALDGKCSSDKFYSVRGARKYNYEVFKCTWDLLSTIPSLNDPKKSVKDEIFKFNETHKKNAKSRLIDKNRNRDNVTRMGLKLKHILKMLVLLLIPERLIENRRIDSWFSPHFFKTNFWYVYASMFGFETWSDLVECKRYFRRFMHDFHRMVRGTGEVVTPYNQYDSMVLPITKWLKRKGVIFDLGSKVFDLNFNPSKKELIVEKIHYTQNNENKEIGINNGDYVFVTNGSMTADSTCGRMSTPAPLEGRKLDGSWTLWENIIKKRPNLGNPSTFNNHIDKTKWVTFNINTKDPIFLDLFEKFTGNKPGQADLVTFKDSNWLMSIHVPYQPHFIEQPDDIYLWGGYGLLADKEGNYVKKKMCECNGEELLTEVCSHFGFIKELPQIIKSSICIPNLMPYECAHFMPRKKSDRPPVVPKGSTNLAFMGQFTESNECVFLVESSIRCGQMAVYKLFNLNKKVPPVYTGIYSLKAWFNALATVFK